METCFRCNQENAIIPWGTSFGPVPGNYCPLCWEILMGMWVLTQHDREMAIELVDATVDVIRTTYGYELP